jgi:serine/threonine protein kinase
MIAPDGRAKILDFGLAVRQVAAADGGDAETTRSPDVPTGAGTVPYMAPELLRGRPADARSDIWALGVLLQEMITGRRPFRGATRYELAAAILGEAAIRCHSRCRRRCGISCRVAWRRIPPTAISSPASWPGLFDSPLSLSRSKDGRLSQDRPSMTSVEIPVRRASLRSWMQSAPLGICQSCPSIELSNGYRRVVGACILLNGRRS